MGIETKDIDALAEGIVHGAEESLVAELTRILIDDMAAGILEQFDRAALETLARANRARIQQALAASRSRIAADVLAQALSCLQQADARDVAALESIYGAAAGTEALSALRATGASEHAAELAHQTARGLSEIIARQNLALADAAERAWYEIAGEAITAKNEGLKPLDRILADAVCRLASAGLETIDYKSGIKSQLDVAVRRHVVSQVSQAGGEMTLARLRAVGHELVITSAHYGARPSHAEWQGQPCCISGPRLIDGVQYPGLVELTGYGTVGGLKGVNCRHSVGPYFPGITKLPDLDFPLESERFGLTSEQHYEATQRQRELERRVRGTKREIAAMEQAGLGLESPTYVQKRLVLGRQQAALRSHVEDKGLVRQYAREKAYGVGTQPIALRSTAWNPKNSPSFNNAVPRSLKKQVDGFLASPPTAPGKTCARIFQDNRSIIRVADTKAARSCFTPATRKLTLRQGCDARTVFHESGHLFDYALKAGSVGNGTWTSARFKVGGTTLGDELRKDYDQLLASRGLVPGKDRELAAAIRAELADAPPRTIVELSDILSGCSSGAAHLGFGHSRAYWMRSPTNLPIEAFANMFSAASTSAEAYAAISRYFPRGVKMFEAMIGAIQ